MRFGYEVEGAKSKRVTADDATRAPMAPRGDRRAPSTDDKKARRKVTASEGIMGLQHAPWLADFDKVSEALKPWVIEIDGDTFLDPSAPEDLARIYQGLVQMGYANGFMASKTGAHKTAMNITCMSCGNDFNATTFKGRSECPECGSSNLQNAAWGSTPKESTMNFNQTEARLLARMATATLPEQRKIAGQLQEIRAQRAEAARASRELGFADAVVTDRRTPAVVANHHTAATDWMGEVPTPDVQQVQKAMHAEASKWFTKVAKAVKAEPNEFTIQAQGYAQAIAGAHAPLHDVAADAFVRHAVFLNRENLPKAASRKVASDYLAEGVCATCGEVIVQGIDAPGTWYHRGTGTAGDERYPSGDAMHRAVPKSASRKVAGGGYAIRDADNKVIHTHVYEGEADDLIAKEDPDGSKGYRKVEQTGAYSSRKVAGDFYGFSNWETGEIGLFISNDYGLYSSIILPKEDLSEDEIRRIVEDSGVIAKTYAGTEMDTPDLGQVRWDEIKRSVDEDIEELRRYSSRTASDYHESDDAEWWGADGLEDAIEVNRMIREENEGWAEASPEKVTGRRRTASVSEEERQALVGESVTLNGEPARISGYQNDFATVRQVKSDGSLGLSAEWAWETVKKVVGEGGKFTASRRRTAKGAADLEEMDGDELAAAQEADRETTAEEEGWARTDPSDTATTAALAAFTEGRPWTSPFLARYQTVAADEDKSDYDAYDSGYAESGLPVEPPQPTGYTDHVDVSPEGVQDNYAPTVAPENAEAVEEEGDPQPMPGAGDDVEVPAKKATRKRPVRKTASNYISVNGRDYEWDYYYDEDYANVEGEDAVVVVLYHADGPGGEVNTLGGITGDFQVSDHGNINASPAFEAYLRETAIELAENVTVDDQGRLARRRTAAAPEVHGDTIEEAVAAAQARMEPHASPSLFVVNVNGARSVVEVMPPAFGPRYTDKGSYESFYGTTARRYIAGTDEDDQAGTAETSLPTPETNPDSMWPWELVPDATGDDAADVGGTPTPGQEIADYPQPKNARRVVARTNGYGMDEDKITTGMKVFIEGVTPAKVLHIGYDAILSMKNWDLSGWNVGDFPIMVEDSDGDQVVVVFDAISPVPTDENMTDTMWARGSRTVSDPARLAAFRARVAGRKTANAFQDAVEEHAKSQGGTISVGDVIDGRTVTEVGTHTIQYSTEDGYSGSQQIPFVGPHGESYPSHDRAKAEASRKTSTYEMECYGCGKKGDNDTFGFGRSRQCPDCGSYEVHGS